MGFVKINDTTYVCDEGHVRFYEFHQRYEVEETVYAAEADQGTGISLYFSLLGG
jgi:hypothetical protein